MCARYEVDATPAAIAAELGATLGGEIAPRRTIAPTDLAPALIVGEDGGPLLVGMRFGWPGTRPGERIHLNTRSESAGRGDSREALAHQRCLLPASAFHEWSGPKGARQHHLFRAQGAPLLTLAGLWLPDDAGGPSRFVILTTAASRDVRPVHHRMPLVVPAALRARWIAVHEEDPAVLLGEVRRVEAPHLEDHTDER